MSDVVTTLSKTFARGPALLEVRVPVSAALARRIVEDKPVSGSTTELGAIALSVQGGRAVPMGSGKGSASFGGSIGAGGRVGVYADGGSAAQALGVDAGAVGGLVLPNIRGQRYGVLEWGYMGRAGGSLALHGGPVPRMHGDARRGAQYAVVRSLSHKTGARTLLTELLTSWELPATVESARDLEPGTWILADVEGSFGMTVGASYGLSMDWVRESTRHGLSGDLGLKVMAGIEASLGFSAAGRFLVVIARESLDASDHMVRVRVFKRRRRGIGFALNAGAVLTPVEDGFLPESFDRFLAAMLGVDGNQLLGVLEGLHEWTDPKQVADNLLGLLPGEVAVEEAEAFLLRLLPDGLGAQSFDEAREKVLDALDRWAALDHEVAAMLWARLDVEDDVERLRSVARRIQEAGDEGVEGVVVALLERAGLEPDVALEWIRVLLGAETLAELLDVKALQRVGAGAERLLNVLDQDLVEGIVSGIHAYVSERLHVERIREWVEGASLADLDTWLRGRIQTFLEKKLTAAGLKDIQNAIAALDEKKEALYEGIRRALHREYNASLQVAYEAASEHTALIDVSIDTAKRGGRDLLRHAIAGEFSALFGSTSSALAVGVGELTHGTRTHLDASLSLPFFQRDMKKLSRSAARLRVEAGASGQVRLYQLKSESIVEHNNTLRSRLSVAGAFASKGGSVRMWTPPEGSTSYEFTAAKKQILRPRLEQILTPLADTYLEDKFEAVPGQASGLSAWLSDLDRTVEAIQQNGADNFGNVVLRLSVAVPPEYLTAWMGAPERDDAAVWRLMSKRMQGTMRKVLVSTLTADSGFMNSGVPKVAGLLVYGSLREDWGVGLFTDGSIGWRMFDTLHWGWEDPTLLEAVVKDRETIAQLHARVSTLHPALAAGGEVKQATLRQLAPDRVGQLVGTALNDIRDPTRGEAYGTLQALLYTEAAAIRAAKAAGKAAARFERLKRGDPVEALEALSSFGTTLTKAFNDTLKGRHWKKALGALSTELFMSAARAFEPGLDEGSRAVLELFVMDEDAPFPPADLEAVGVDNLEGVALQQRVVG